MMQTKNCTLAIDIKNASLESILLSMLVYKRFHFKITDTMLTASIQKQTKELQFTYILPAIHIHLVWWEYHQLRFTCEDKHKAKVMSKNMWKAK